MIVVANTSPLTNLAAIGQFDLLRQLFGEIQIANGVWDELNRGGQRYPGSAEVSSAQWVTRHSVQNRPLVMTLQRDLDLGEAETIALALDLDAGLVLMDEKEARRAAQRLGLKVIGVVGVLLEANFTGVIDDLKSHLDDLRQKAGFYISDSLYWHALELAKEG